MRRAGFFAVVLLVLAVGLGGCGDDDGGDAGEAQAYQPEASTTMTTASLTNAQFVNRLNKICRRAWTTVVGNWHEYTGTLDQKLSKAKRFEEAVPLSLLAGLDFHIFDNVRRLGAPPGRATAIEEMIGPFQVAVELGWKNRWTARSIEEIPPHFEEYNAHARRHGLDDCVVDEAHLKPIENLGRPAT
ncbi:MAG TPA: hypothetical protein VFU04_00215 [Solirubrobacterales bacterium]|nr:hypothetical protein [Solirubrobacterales bacterium]